jgi:hypothetical protein
MNARLMVQEQDGRITVLLQPGGQLVANPAGAPFEFKNPFTPEQREDLRWLSGRLSAGPVCGL